MATRSVLLNPHLEQVVNDLVVSGRYQSASEVLREGLRLLEQREAEESAKAEGLRKVISTGLKSLQDGDLTRVRAEDLEGFIASLAEQISLPITENH